MLTIKSNENITKGVFANLNLTLNNTGMVFVCGKKESKANDLVKIIGGVVQNENYYENFTVELDDFLLDDVKKVEDYRFNYIGFVFGNSQYAENEKVITNVLSSCAPYVEQISQENVDNVLNVVGLSTKKDEDVMTLSEYELHCLDIARALIKSPKVIIANNPIARLNNEETTKIWNLLKSISKDHLVIVSNSLQEVAKVYADVIIRFEEKINLESVVESISIVELNKVETSSKVLSNEKTNKFNFSSIFKISTNLLRNSIFLMVLMTLTFTLFLVGLSSKDAEHYKFALALNEKGVERAIIKRNTSKADRSISKELRTEVESVSESLLIEWGYYLSSEVDSKYPAHSRNTKYNYPEAFISINSEEKNKFKLIAGSWNDENTGVYISETDAKNYIKYFNEYAPVDKSVTRELHAAYNVNFPSGKTYNKVDELVGDKLLYVFAKVFKELKVAGIYEDNHYTGNLVIIDTYNAFPDSFNKESFYSIGILNFSDNVQENAKILAKYATIIRNEQERVYITTELDDIYSELVSSTQTIPGKVNIATLIFLILTIGGSYLLSYLLIATYRKELTISRTYGLKKSEIIKVSIVKNLIISLISFVASIIITLLGILVVNLILKAKYDYIVFSYFTLPLSAYLIAFAGSLVLTGVYTALSIVALKRHDYIVY